MVKVTRVAFYARYSSESQREASIEDQFRNLARRAEQEGWRVVARFADKAITGKRADRPQMQAALAAAKAGKFNLLLVDEMTRFSRDTVDSELLSEEFAGYGVRVVALDGYDSAAEDADVKRAAAAVGNVITNKQHARRTHRGQEGQVAKGYHGGGRAYGYALQPILDATQRDQFGQPVRVGTLLKLDKAQAKIVAEIFRRFAGGESERGIAAKLNARRVPSPGSVWKRKTRRAGGWMGSAIRAMLNNPTYSGSVVWNRSVWSWKRVEGTRQKRRVRKERPRAEWKVREDESLRIVPAAVWVQVEKRLGDRARVLAAAGKEGTGWRSGYKPKYVLSGLLRCGECHSHFILCSKTQYGCSTNIGGKGCSNAYRINREHTERVVLDAIHKKLLAPATVKQMAAELEAEYGARLKANATTAAEAPREVQELDERIGRLRERLKKGDPDLTPDELEDAIRTAERKRLEKLHAAQPARARASAAKVFAALPNAAKLYERQIRRGLSGNAEEAAKARMILKDMCGGKIDLEVTARGLVARSHLFKSVLIRAVGSDGSGGRI